MKGIDPARLRLLAAQVLGGLRCPRSRQLGARQSVGRLGQHHTTDFLIATTGSRTTTRCVNYEISLQRPAQQHDPAHRGYSRARPSALRKEHTSGGHSSQCLRGRTDESPAHRPASEISCNLFDRHWSAFTAFEDRNPSATARVKPLACACTRWGPTSRGKTAAPSGIRPPSLVQRCPMEYPQRVAVGTNNTFESTASCRRAPNGLCGWRALARANTGTTPIVTLIGAPRSRMLCPQFRRTTPGPTTLRGPASCARPHDRPGFRHLAGQRSTTGRTRIHLRVGEPGPASSERNHSLRAHLHDYVVAARLGPQGTAATTAPAPPRTPVQHGDVGAEPTTPLQDDAHRVGGPPETPHGRADGSGAQRGCRDTNHDVGLSNDRRSPDPGKRSGFSRPFARDAQFHGRAESVPSAHRGGGRPWPPARSTIDRRSASRLSRPPCVDAGINQVPLPRHPPTQLAGIRLPVMHHTDAPRSPRRTR